jgi:hypothetical protein
MHMLELVIFEFESVEPLVALSRVPSPSLCPTGPSCQRALPLISLTSRPRLSVSSSSPQPSAPQRPRPPHVSCADNHCPHRMCSISCASPGLHIRTSNPSAPLLIHIHPACFPRSARSSVITIVKVVPTSPPSSYCCPYHGELRLDASRSRLSQPVLKGKPNANHVHARIRNSHTQRLHK